MRLLCVCCGVDFEPWHVPIGPSQPSLRTCVRLGTLAGPTIQDQKTKTEKFSEDAALKAASEGISMLQQIWE